MNVDEFETYYSVNRIRVYYKGDVSKIGGKHEIDLYGCILRAISDKRYEVLFDDGSIHRVSQDDIEVDE